MSELSFSPIVRAPIEERVLNEQYFRRNTKVQKVSVGYLMAAGGLGDYIGYLSAIEWLARTQPQLNGTVYTADFFIPIASNVLSAYPKWKVVPRSELTDEKIKAEPLCMPNRFITRIGSNAVDLGFIYYAYLNPAPPDGWYYTKLDLRSVLIDDELVPKQPYAVMTPYSTKPNRAMTVKAFNGIKNHLISKGVTPAFVGRKEFADGRPAVEAQEGYDFSGGIDLTEKTTLLEAAKIMSHAKMVIGIDNGLTHLAAMTEVPIILGFTIASPKDAEPRRKSERIYRIYPDRSSLPCTFCQSRMRFFIKHDFGTCLYKDNLCTEVIGVPDDWNALIDKCLKDTNAE